jgi:hypothetical protein
MIAQHSNIRPDATAVSINVHQLVQQSNWLGPAYPDKAVFPWEWPLAC